MGVGRERGRFGVRMTRRVICRVRRRAASIWGETCRSRKREVRACAVSAAVAIPDPIPPQLLRSQSSPPPPPPLPLRTTSPLPPRDRRSSSAESVALTTHHYRVSWLPFLHSPPRPSEGKADQRMEGKEELGGGWRSRWKGSEMATPSVGCPPCLLYPRHPLEGSGCQGMR